MRGLVLLGLALALLGCGRLGHGATPKDGDAAAGDMPAAEGDGGDHRANGVDDVEAEYTPRHHSDRDEEACDEVARELLTRLRAQRDKLAQRAEELAQREHALAAQGEAATALTKQIEARVAELTQLTTRVEQQLAHPDEAAEAARRAHSADAARRLAEQVQSSGQLIGSMPPSKAAALLAQMQDAALAAGVLHSLPGEQAGRVLAQMRPEVAARLMEQH